MKRTVVLCLALVAVAAFAGHHEGKLDAASKKALKAAIEGDHRTDAQKARDQYRHPMETLAFFGVTKDKTVVEVSPGGGWYMNILAPYLNDSGKYIGASYDRDSESEGIQRRLKATDELIANNSKFSKATLSEFAPPAKTTIAPAGTADVVLTFRSAHGWMRRDMLDTAFESFFAALKPGGVLGLVQHRANTDQPQDPKAGKGYVREDFIIAAAEKAGFKLEAKSEINANAKDTKDYENGVWTLPPVMTTREKDGDKYKSIGESDRMTLKFVKPAN